MPTANRLLRSIITSCYCSSYDGTLVIHTIKFVRPLDIDRPHPGCGKGPAFVTEPYPHDHGVGRRPGEEIHGPKVYGVRPGSPFLYRVPATATRPMTFEARGLPAGLQLDPNTGIITGRLAERGEHAVTIIARNSHGEAQRTLHILVGTSGQALQTHLGRTAKARSRYGAQCVPVRHGGRVGMGCPGRQ